MSHLKVQLGALALGAAVTAFAGTAIAQEKGVVMMPKLSAKLANELVGESVAACAAKGYPVVAVVVDLDGVRQAVLRGDNAPIHSMDNAYFKAYTVASMGPPRKEETTKAIADRLAKAAPTTVPTVPLPNVTYAQGGVAIKSGETFIGAIGVSGAPGGHLDEECIRTAMAKIADRIK